ncbi:3-oxoacyl-[acyl-carrier-protein] reductase FabG [Pelagimonas phthalicica]|uniref:3-oxoacyl-[acyl-carrier-protein] reductase FabG n=1 Tax=Pelagimonas phthalicica TaxID=1037362 RepID=A0A238J830_9RHOB|nr:MULTISPECIES: 3-oxoacyl-ACP reductase family protein [Roseobacteraceae]MBO9463673.1 3-oxoacyl-ACP reductase FabG [Tropicibacter sp. R15_0]TDS95451.1 3-oxoacyl-[acyl-carrier-protein] reductase [Pelagimonas phthalicica]SMX26026.1 3-oxoacyl-[acyl-carrier-protein] reductase FabG [Pelagimonas phthalicica]
MKLLEGKTALVTGASRGIGRAVAVEFAKQGANLVVNASRASAEMDETVELIKDAGAQVITSIGSVDQEESARAMVGAAVETFGSLDILVNNAGITRDKPLMMMKEEDFDDVISVNLRGTYQCSREAARQMMKQRSGRIIQVSSISALSGRPGQCNYAASKSALVGFTKSLARELGKFNVLVNALYVGVIDTDLTKKMPAAAKKTITANIPLGRVGTPEEVAGPCVFLGSDLSTFVNGTTINISGGGYV